MTIDKEVLDRLDELEVRYDELNNLMADPGVAKDSDRLQGLQRESGGISQLVALYRGYKKSVSELAEAQELHDDPVLKQMADDEVQAAMAALASAEADLLDGLRPADPDDDKNCFLEIRAGTGGLESSLFAGDLFRMYGKWGERHSITLTPVSTSPAEAGGYKEMICRVDGRNAYALFKHEAGTHRVQRVPETESQGRIHTSVCTVAVMPETKIEDVDINPSDLRVDTYKSSGAGGQHVNTTDSAVRVTHLPTGIVAECQESRSQHRNREQAMAMLAARVRDHHRRIKEAEIVDSRRKMVGSGERNEKIRTYNYPQGRVTDHRVSVTVRRLKEVMEGDLEEIHQALHQAERGEWMKDFVNA